VDCGGWCGKFESLPKEVLEKRERDELAFANVREYRNCGVLPSGWGVEEDELLARIEQAERDYRY